MPCFHQASFTGLPSDHLRVCRDVFADPAGEVAVGRCDPDGDGAACPVGLTDDVGLTVGLAVGVDVWPGEAVGLGVGDAVGLGVAPGLDRTTKGRDVKVSVFLPFWAWPVPLVAVTSKM